MAFTKEELAVMAAADAEIEAEFRLTPEDLARSRALDREAVLEQMDSKQRKVAASQKAYREANRDKYNAYMREYRRKRREVALQCRE